MRAVTDRSETGFLVDSETGFRDLHDEFGVEVVPWRGLVSAAVWAGVGVWAFLVVGYGVVLAFRYWVL